MTTITGRTYTLPAVDDRGPLAVFIPHAGDFPESDVLFAVRQTCKRENYPPPSTLAGLEWRIEDVEVPE